MGQTSVDFNLKSVTSLAVWPWVNCITSLCLTFLICNIRVIIPLSQMKLHIVYKTATIVLETELAINCSHYQQKPGLSPWDPKAAAKCPVLVSTDLEINWAEPGGERHSSCPWKELGKPGADKVPLCFNSVISTIKGFDQTISKDLIAHSSKTLWSVNQI